MFLSSSKTKNNEYLRIAETVYVGKKKKTVILENLGSVAELKKKFPDRDPHEVARLRLQEMRDRAKAEEQVIIQTHHCSRLVPLEQERAFKHGYLFLQRYYYQLGLAKLCAQIQKSHKMDYDLNDVLSKLIYTRILDPSSKKASFEISQNYLEAPSFALHDVYRALELVSQENEHIQEVVYKNSKKLVERQDKILFYDCTNYFFEIEEESGNKQYGFSKEHRPNPLIQMGLFLDGSGFPLAFSIHPGNMNEQQTLQPLEKRILKDFGLSKFIVCTDAGLSSTANRKFNDRKDRAFITTQSLKKLKSYLKEWALNPTGWSLGEDSGTYDLRQVSLEIEADMDKVYYKSRWIKEDGLEQQLMVSFSPKYRLYLRNLRQRQIERAEKKLATPSRLKNNRSNDPRRYIATVSYTDSGELAEHELYGLDEAAILEDEAYDGFYAVCTNLDAPVHDILSINKQRWQIEAAFRTLKTEFKARPVYLSREDRILAHFTLCFLALLIYKHLEHDLNALNPNRSYSTREAISTLKNMTLFPLGGQGYAPAYKRTLITDDLHTLAGFRTDYEALSNQTMKNIISASKKR